MSAATSIEWTDSTWNPIVGCSIVSPGCTNCYAMAMAARINKMTLASHYEGLTHKVNGHQVWTGKVSLAPDYLFTAPLRLKKPKRIFVNSMGDLFHEAIPDEWIDRVFEVAGECDDLGTGHVLQVLTKRSERQRDYLNSIRSYNAWNSHRIAREAWPPRNMWFGVSAERQQEYDARQQHLRATPAIVHFFSFEPLLGPIKADYLGEWAIVGGESGPKARPMHPQWARDLRDQCQASGVPYFFKQWGGWQPLSDDQRDWGRDWMLLDRNGILDIPDDRVPMDEYGEVAVRRVGKKAAGRLLDGREWNEFPAAWCPSLPPNREISP